jgi:hypothetical protein
MKKLFLEIKEWFADLADCFRLVVIESAIEDLNQQINEANKLGKEFDTNDLLMLKMFSKSHRELLRRINAREAQHEQAMVAH